MALLLISCGTSKKTTTSKGVEKTAIEIKETTKDSIVKEKDLRIIKKDSIVKEKEILPTESVIEFDLSDIINMEGDIKLSTGSLDGSGTTIIKKGNKLIIKTKTAGSKSIETKVVESEIIEKEIEIKTKEVDKEVKKETEITIEETTTVKTRVPFMFRIFKFLLWLLIPLILIFIFRKFLLKNAVNLFPGFRATKIFTTLNKKIQI